MIKTVRITHYKSFGGRPAGVRVAHVSAILIMSQNDGTVVVELLEAVFGFNKGHNIALYPKHIL